MCGGVAVPPRIPGDESWSDAVKVLNQESAYEMWKHMMQAGEDFINCNSIAAVHQNSALPMSALAVD
jgi:hypothetical protein